LLASIGVIVAAAPASALTLPSGFSFVTIPTGASTLTNFVFLPDGTDTMLAIGKCGPVRRVTQTGTSVAVSFTPAGTTVNCEGDRGLVGIDLARDYATSGIVYLTYDYKDAAGKYWGRLSQVTVNSVTAPTAFGSERIIIDQFPSFSTTSGATCDDSHTVGTVLVAPDGTLFVGNGDSSSYCSVDNSALAAQDVNSPRGKILHINPADGSGVSSNPFFQAANPSSWQSRVFALGFRNPFRFSLKPGSSSTLYIGEVGWNSYEEVDVAKGGENFGWPCWEGPATFRNGYDALSQCQGLYANPPAKLTAPLYYWNHFNSGGDASMGGVVYTGSSYPTDYQGAYFFADHVVGRLWSLRTDGNDAIVRAPETNGFGNAIGLPVGFRSGPNGDIFFADIGSGNIQRLRYAAGNRAPTAVATADKLAGNAPLTVAFDGSGSFDLDDEPLTYAWTFGDGGTSTAAKPSHTFTGSSVYTVTLTVTDQLGAKGTTTLSVNTRNNPPVLTVTVTPNQPTFKVGDAIHVAPSATDAEDGTIPRSAITIQQIQHHCPTPGNCHLHPGAVSTAPASGTYDTVMPDHGDDSYLEILVTATDSAGAAATKSVTLPTEEHNLSVSSAPAGVSIVVNATNSIANPVLKEVAGSQNRVIAPATSGNFVFMRWADGTTTPDRTFTMPQADLTLQAQYDTRPTAVAGATPTSGAAPLAVQFNSTGSTDPDAGDSIVSYAWAFGDNTTGTGAAPAHTYTANGSYAATLTVTDTRGATGTATATVTVGATGTAITPPWGTGWRINGQASVATPSGPLTLTPNVAAASGSAFWPTAVPTANLTASFNLLVDQGNGADGMAFVLGNPAAGALPTMVGGSGGALGAAGIPGIAVTFDTFKNGTDPSNNFVGVATTGSGLAYAQTSTAVPPLRNATVHVDVVVSTGQVKVSLNGTTYLTTAITVPVNAYVGFSASTGGLTDRHQITAFTASYGGTAPPPPAQVTVTPTALAFGEVAAGTSMTKTFSIANTGGSPLTVNSVTGPAAPFSMSGAPAAGSTMNPGASATVTVQLAPTQTGTWSSSIQVSTSAGAPTTVTLSGTTSATPPPAQLSVTPGSLPFGTVSVGASATKTFSIANTGGSPLTVNSVTGPAAPFSMTGAPANNTTLNPGQSVTVTVGFAPTAPGTFTSSISITTSVGPASVALTGATPTGGGTVVPPPGAGWQINGQASVAGGVLTMTPNVAAASGSAFWPTAVATANLHAVFNLTIDQGNGADGAAFVLGNPAAGAQPTMVGGSGGALGAAGIPGVAVTFDTFQNTGDPSNNFIGIAVSGGGLTYSGRTSTAIPTLRNSTQTIDVQVAGGVMTVKVGGVTKLTSTLALPATAYVGFSASTGGLTDRHMVSNVSISV
jgi:PKD repeat protein